MLGAVEAVIRPEGSLIADGEFAEVGQRFTGWLADAGADWVLVRPDGYVADAGRGSRELDSSLGALSSELSA